MAMRVLIVTNTYPPADISGVGTLVAELARELDRRSHRVVVLCRTADPKDPLAAPTGGSKLLFPLKALVALRRLGGLGKFDLVHLHESDGVVVGLLARWRRFRGAPRPRVAATLQVSYREERRAVRVLRDERGGVLSRPTLGERIFAWVRAPILSLLGRITAHCADAVVAPSRQTALELERDYGTRVAAVIPNGVEPPREPPRRHERGPYRFLYAGRLRTRKAVAVLVRAFALLPRGRATLEIVGTGEHHEAIRSLVRELGIEGEVELSGALPPQAMPARYRAADAFCLPSTYEGLPLAILEAMGYGLPVITTAVSGNPEAVVDRVTGVIVAPCDVGAFAQAMRSFLDDPEAAFALGLAGRRRLLDAFAIAPVCGAYLELWSSLAQGHGRR
jgi:glycosyltransferase involved in cell wall biosynthesis